MHWRPLLVAALAEVCLDAVERANDEGDVRELINRWDEAYRRLGGVRR